MLPIIQSWYHQTTGMRGMTIQPAEIDITKLIVYCDEESDRQQFYRFQQISKILGQIPTNNIRILPKGKISRREEFAVINALTEKDRPDYTFMYDDTPVLIVEGTEHGYTGDNPKQRFVRFREAARAKVPCIYFTPFSRVRDDELDAASGRSPSKRRVNTDVWKGMVALMENHGVPIVPVEWQLAANGKVRKPGTAPSTEVIKEIYGELVSLMEEILVVQASMLSSEGRFSTSGTIDQYINRTKKLCETSNTRGSDVTIWMNRTQLRELLDDPKRILNYIKRDEYFHKGKAFKLVALSSIDFSEIKWILMPDGSVINTSSPSSDLNKLLEASIFEETLVYYTGYEWRSDPHCGVATLLELLYCLAEDAVSHSKGLVLHWPRVSLNSSSSAYQNAMKAIINARDSQSHFRQLFINRYGERNADRELDKVLLDKRGSVKPPYDLVGLWSERTKQARVFRDVCDLIILSDAIIIGNRLK
jgi:hypothetical protein